MTAKDRIIHLWDLPEDSVFVKLSNNAQKILIEKALEFFRNENELAKHLNSKQTTVNNFLKTINFSLKEKRNKLKQVLNSYDSRTMFKKGSVFEEVLKVCKELKDKRQKITNKNIAKRLKRVESYIRQITFKMVKEGKLKVSKERMNLGGRKGARPKEFDLI